MTKATKHRVLIGVIIEMDATGINDAAEKAAKVAAGLGFNFSGPGGYTDAASWETKLLSVEKVTDG